MLGPDIAEIRAEVGPRLMQESTMSNRLYVGNLPYETSEQDLQTLFAQAGNVETVTVVRDRDTGRARGFGFVEMATDQDAQNAIGQLHDQQFGGRRLTVNEARPQAPRPRGGFGGRGPSHRSEPRW